MTIAGISGAEFGTTLAVAANHYAWFLGAGSSASANIPTGYDMITDFKARLFCANVKIPRREIDPSDPLWRGRINAHLDGQYGMPPNGDPGEYAAAFEAVFPEVADRRRYIEAAVRQGTPSFGHRVLAALIESGQVPCLFTTNFDQLIERAAVLASEALPTDQRALLTVSPLDAVERAERCLSESAWPLLVKLHGDFQSVDLKNTASELQAQDAVLRRVLVAVCNRFGLIVAGYSGRDDSVMDALRHALEGESPFPAGVRWALRSATPPLPAVVDFMETAVRRGVDARWVHSEAFDELAADIDRQVTLPAELADHVRTKRPSPIVQPVSIAAEEGGRFPALRLSALPVLDLPRTARRLRLAGPITTPEARSILRAAGARGVVAARGDVVIAFGADAELLRAFESHGGVLDGEEDLVPAVDSLHLGLVYDALVRALTRRRPLRPILKSRGHSIVVTEPRPGQTPEQAHHDQDRLAQLKNSYGSDLVGTVPGTDLRFAEGLRLSLETHDDRWWCVFDPYTWVDFPWSPEQGDMARPVATLDSRRRSPGPAGDWRRERWARRYNPLWSAVLDGWSSLLIQGKVEELTPLWFSDEPGINAGFSLSSTTGWSRPARTSIAPARPHE